MNLQILLSIMPILSLGFIITLMSWMMYKFRHNGAYKDPYPISVLLIMSCFFIMLCLHAPTGSMTVQWKNEPPVPFEIRQKVWKLQKEYPTYQFTVVAPEQQTVEK